MEENLQIGKIANTHGVKGEVKVLPLTDDPQRYEKLKWVYLDRQGNLEKLYIEGVKYFKGFVILKFKNIDSMDDAEKIKDLFLEVDRTNAIKLPEDAYFICDLIECEVFVENGKSLGKIKDVLKTGSNDVYIVRNENDKEILVPALKSVVKNISIRDKKITVELPKGLINNEV